jgi:hypothetical protein
MKFQSLLEETSRQAMSSKTDDKSHSSISIRVALHPQIFSEYNLSFDQLQWAAKHPGFSAFLEKQPCRRVLDMVIFLHRS